MGGARAVSGSTESLRAVSAPNVYIWIQISPNSLHSTSKEDPNQGSKYFTFWIQIGTRAKHAHRVIAYVLSTI